MSAREENIRIRIQATSELPVVKNQLEELLKLQRLIATQIGNQTLEMRYQGSSRLSPSVVLPMR